MMKWCLYCVIIIHIKYEHQLFDFFTLILRGLFEKFDHVTKTDLILIYRCSVDEQSQFMKKKGFHLIANQLHQHPASQLIIESCFFFLTGHQTSIDEPLAIVKEGLEPSQNSFTNNGAILLLALLDRCLMSPDEDGIFLCRSLLSKLVRIFQL